MWEIMWPILEQYGVPIGLLLSAVIALAWAWKKERDDNRLLNRHLQKSAKETTAALIAVKFAAEAQKELLGALSSHLGRMHETIMTTTTSQREQYDRHSEKLDRRLEAIEKKLSDLPSFIASQLE